MKSNIVILAAVVVITAIVVLASVAIGINLTNSRSVQSGNTGNALPAVAEPIPTEVDSHSGLCPAGYEGRGYHSGDLVA